MEKLLSVVVPVYNMEDYLRQTLDSLVCDRMDLLQVVIVNDGSSDSSLEIARGWAERCPGSAKVIDKPNGGHGSAWNVGAEQACARYLAFLDSDDWVHDISGFLSRLESAGADMVFSDCITYHEEDGSQTAEVIRKIGPGVHEFAEEALPLAANSCRMTNFHYCVYRTGMLKPLMPLFHEKTSYDDMVLSLAPLVHSATYEYSGMPFYVYRVGRADQSMAPEVISRKIHQQEAERKYAVGYGMRHCPIGDRSLKAQAVHEISRAICVTFYNFVMKLDKARRKEYLESWSEYVARNISEPDRIFEYSAYLKLPMPLYRLALKPYHLFKRIRRSFHA